MTTETAISVIIPCYNHGHYLPDAVRSVLAQTFDNWEAIIVDDGSTDDTRDAAAQFTDPRIRYIYQQNQGLSAARNAGIRAAQAPYLAFLDADDEWEPRFLEASAAALAEREGATASITRTKFIDEAGRELPRLGGEAVSAEILRSRLLEGGFFPVHAVLVRAEAVRRAGMFDESLSSLEDWDLWLRITERGDTMVSIPEPLARYRIYPGSMSTNAGCMHSNRMAILTKHLGAADGAPTLWPDEKRRAYAFAYRSSAFGYLQARDPEAAWRWLGEASRAWPPILTRLDTYYELALGDQPRGFRGDATSVDLTANGEEMMRRLDALMATAPEPVAALRGPALGNAHLALGMLADQAGDWAAARRHLLRAVRSHPRLLASASVIRRLAKVSLGQRIVSSLRHETRGRGPASGSGASEGAE